MQKPLLKTSMHPFPYTIGAHETLPRATAVMREHSIRHLPVTEAGEIVGILSQRDIRLAQSLTNLIKEDAELTVGEVCTRDPYVVDINMPLNIVLSEMSAMHIGSVLVTRNDKLVGIFTTTDACRIFGEHLRRQFGETPTEPEIA
ncbi:MAG: CBS domain-containing protein [Bdellovibrionales bacterium]|nr:CBS domain-containing protein [Bdellovibrionales bacterium]